MFKGLHYIWKIMHYCSVDPHTGSPALRRKILTWELRHLLYLQPFEKLTTCLTAVNNKLAVSVLHWKSSSTSTNMMGQRNVENKQGSHSFCKWTRSKATCIQHSRRAVLAHLSSNWMCISSGHAGPPPRSSSVPNWQNFLHAFSWVSS